MSLKDTVTIQLFYKYFEELLECIAPEFIVPHLFSKGTITAEEYREFIDETRPRPYRCGKLLSFIPERYAIRIFLEAIYNPYPDLHQKLSVESALYLPKSPQRENIDDNTNTPLMRFAEKLKNKVHNGIALDHMETFKLWSSKLKMAVTNCHDLRRKQMIADRCFILLDTMLVIERTYFKNKANLSESKTFSDLRSMIADCSNHDLAQIKYHARYAMALIYSGRVDQAEPYIDYAISRLSYYLPGREIGNCFYVRVNLNLKRYADKPSKDLELKIIQDVDQGLKYFEHDDLDIKMKWRNVYLDKKLCCYLNIGLFLEDVKGHNETAINATKKEISSCLGEMRSNFEFMDRRRKMHYFRHETKFHSIIGNPNLAKAFLQEALLISREVGFEKETENLLELSRISNCPNNNNCVQQITDIDFTNRNVSNNRDEQVEKNDADSDRDNTNSAVNSTEDEYRVRQTFISSDDNCNTCTDLENASVSDIFQFFLSDF